MTGKRTAWRGGIFKGKKKGKKWLHKRVAYLEIGEKKTEKKNPEIVFRGIRRGRERHGQKKKNGGVKKPEKRENPKVFSREGVAQKKGGRNGRKKKRQQGGGGRSQKKRGGPAGSGGGGGGGGGWGGCFWLWEAEVGVWGQGGFGGGGGEWGGGAQCVWGMVGGWGRLFVVLLWVRWGGVVGGQIRSNRLNLKLL